MKKIAAGICVISRGLFCEDNPREIVSAFHQSTIVPTYGGRQGRRRDLAKRPFKDGDRLG